MAATLCYALSLAVAGAQTISAPSISPAGPTAIGGVNSIAQVAHQWMQYIDTAGLPHLAQPSFADLATGTASCAQLPALTGPVTTTAGSCGTVIGTAAVTYAMIQNVAASRLWGNPTGSASPGSEISLGATLSFVGSALQTGAGTGDVAWAANTFATTLATVNSNVGSFGSATQASQITVNAKGLLTAVANVTVTPAIASVTGLGTNVETALTNPAGGTGGFALNSQLASYLALAGGTMSGNIAMGGNAITGAGAITGTTITGTAYAGLPVGTNAVKGVVEGDGSTISCVAGVCTATGASATAVTPLTTTVTGGTNNDVLNVTNTGCSAGSPCLAQTGIITLLNAVCTLFPSTCAVFFGYYNVIWYGADPTGVASSTTAINNAEAAACAPSVAGVVYAPPGTYLVNGGINATNITNGCTIKGGGLTATIFKTTSTTNAILDLTGSSAVKLLDFQLYGTGSATNYGVLLAQSSANSCNVLNLSWMSISGTWQKAPVYNYGCTNGYWGQSQVSNSLSSDNPTAVVYWTATNDLTATSSYATIATGTLQSGAWLFDTFEIHDQAVASGFSSIIPLYISGTYGPLKFSGGVIAGSVGSTSGGTVTMAGATVSGVSFDDTQLYADSGTQSAYAFYAKTNVTGLNIQGDSLLYGTAVFTQSTGVIWDNLNFNGNGAISGGSLFAPQSGGYGLLTQSFVNAQGLAINMGSSGTLTHTIMIQPGTLTAGTQGSNGSF